VTSKSKRTLILLLACGLSIAVGEAVMRTLQIAPAVRPIVLHTEQTAYKRSRNPILAYELKANYLDDSADPRVNVPRTNSHGQRDIERTAEKPDGVRRIVLLGDSVVAGVGLRDIDDTISRQLEKLYDDNGTEVLNFGIDGYNTLAEIELLRTKALAFKPDHVVLVFVPNDYNDFVQEAWPIDSHRRYPYLLRTLFLKSHLFRLASVQFNLFHFGVMADPDRWNREKTGNGNVARGLAQLRHLAEQHHFGVTIVAWPHFDSGTIRDEHFVPDGDELIIERLARMHGLPCVRISPYLQAHREREGIINPREWYTTGDAMHPSSDGSKVAATALLHILRDQPSAVISSKNPTIPIDEATLAAAAAAAGRPPPDRFALLLIIANRHLAAGEHSDARRYLELAIAAAPNNAEARVNLGMSLRHMGDLDGAERQYQQALLTDPENAEAHNNLGMLLLDRGDLRRARLRFTRAVEIEPKAIFLVNLGLATERGGDLAQAETLYARAIKENPNYAKSYNNLGVLYADQGNRDRAITLLKRAAELNPSYADPFYNMGRLYELAKRPDLALPLLRRAAELNPNDSDMRVAHERVRTALTRREGRAADSGQTE